MGKLRARGWLAKHQQPKPKKPPAPKWTPKCEAWTETRTVPLTGYATGMFGSYRKTEYLECGKPAIARAWNQQHAPRRLCKEHLGQAGEGWRFEVSSGVMLRHRVQWLDDGPVSVPDHAEIPF